MNKLVKNMTINHAAIQRNLEIYAPFACTERVMMALSKKGADRQETHERLRNHAMTAWQAVQQGEKNPLTSLLKKDAFILQHLTAVEVEALSDITSYTGIAPSASRELVIRIQSSIKAS